MGIGGLVQLLKGFNLLAEQWQKFSAFAAKVIPVPGSARISKECHGGGFLYKTHPQPCFSWRGLYHGPRWRL